MLQSMVSQRVGHNWVTEQQNAKQAALSGSKIYFFGLFSSTAAMENSVIS